MSNDYAQTLPPIPGYKVPETEKILPEHPGAGCGEGWTMQEMQLIEAYGHAVAEAARAPLLAQIKRMETVIEGMQSFWNEDHDELENAKSRIAELEAENQTLTRECSNAEDESGRLEEELQKEQDENDRLRALLAQHNKEPTPE